jgi:uncharacterized protein YfaT (DUF1175 family)
MSRRRPLRVLRAVIVLVSLAASTALAAPLDDSDRAAFRAWFTYLADAQFERTTADVTDCAALVRHAYREALRPHGPEWFRRNALPAGVTFSDVRHAPAASGGAWPLFRVSRDPDRFAEFADAATIVRLNARSLGRDARAAQPGDLLYFHQDDAAHGDHLMVVVGRSVFDRDRSDWVVYHTGPDGASGGEVRKVSLADLARHPATRWRPVAENPAFRGVYRLSMLDAQR